MWQAATGKSLIWAADRLAAHRHAYPVLKQWQQDTVIQAMFDDCAFCCKPAGLANGGARRGTNKRTLLNFMRRGGADMTRLAAIAGHEAGIHICAPVHDAFWITAPLSELDDAIATMSSIMVRASKVITGGLEIPVEISAEVRWPQCLGDVRKSDAKGRRCGLKSRIWCAAAAYGRCHEAKTTEIVPYWAGPSRRVQRLGQASGRSSGAIPSATAHSRNLR